jgi:hypothetical protein
MRLADPAVRVRLAQTLPLDFRTLRVTGCRTLRFAGRDLLEICFDREGRHYHLYVLDRRGVRGLPAQPRFFSPGGGSVAVWSDQRHAYALIGDDVRALEAVL